MNLKLPLIALGILLLVACSSNLYAQKEVDDAELETILNSDKLIILDFYATWCNPCKRMHPIYSKLANEYRKSVIFLQMDIDKNEFDNKCNITAVPTFLLIKGVKIVKIINGVADIDSFKVAIEKYK
jgi:thioredoxin 1